MKHFFRLTTVLTLLLIYSCGKDDEPETPANKAPEISAQTFNASETIDDATVIGRVSATDADGDDLTFSIKSNSNGLFEIANTGDISLAEEEVLDFETATNHTLSIDVTDGEATANAEITVNVIDVNENQPPLFVAQTFTISENTALQTEVGVLGGTDPDGDTISYSWAQPSTVSAFQLVNDSNGGRILTANNVGGNLDFETTPQYVIAVIASDGILTTQADITINVTDFNDAPKVSAQTFTVAEDIDDNTVVGRVVATDQDGDALTFTIDADPDNLFEITNGADISLQTGKSLDFETKTSHTVDIRVTDGNVPVITTVTINVTDVAETAITVSTLAGSTSGNTNGTGTAAQFNSPISVVATGSGDILVTDRLNDAIKRITPAGVVTTLFTSSDFGAIRGIAFDNQNNLYVSDTQKHIIWKLEPSAAAGGGYTLSVFAGSDGNSGTTDGSGTSALFNVPSGLAIDSNDNLYVADRGNRSIRRITSSGVVSTIIDPAVSGLTAPEDVAVASDGTVFVSDVNGHFIGKVESNRITLVVGNPGGFPGNTDGAVRGAVLNGPAGMVIDGNSIYLASNGNSCIRKIDIATNTITTIVGPTDGSRGNVDGDDSTARFRNPIGITIDSSGNLYMADTNNHTIRKIEFPQP